MYNLSYLVCQWDRAIGTMALRPIAMGTANHEARRYPVQMEKLCKSEEQLGSAVSVISPAEGTDCHPARLLVNNQVNR